MSLTLATLAGLAVYKKSRLSLDPPFSGHRNGLDVLGSVGYKVDVPAGAPERQAFIQSRTGAYLTSVAAGLTVAGILAAGGYLWARHEGLINGRKR